MPENGIKQWGWRDMEELLQCPVCLDIPAAGVVEQCRHGHHLCAACKTQVDSCPLCKCEFHGTRNFVVEELLRHFEVLKNTMLLNNVAIEAKPKKKKETKPDEEPPVFISGKDKRKLNTPNPNKGEYPCRIMDCNIKLPVSRLLNHMRTCHSSTLTESNVDFTDLYSQTWDVPFSQKDHINRNTYVISVGGIGLIFLIIEVLRTGQCIVVVQAAMKFIQAQNFLACVELFNGDSSYSYYARLVSVREGMEGILEKKLCYTVSKNRLKRICINKQFKCKLRLSRFTHMDASLLTRPNVEQIGVIKRTRAALLQAQIDELQRNNERPTENPHAMAEQGQILGLEQQFEMLQSSLRTLSESFQRTEASINFNGNSESASSSASRNEQVFGRRRHGNGKTGSGVRFPKRP